jgi:hypothetical protein
MSERIDPGAVQRHIDDWNALPPLHRARASIAELFVDTDHDALALASIAEELVATQIAPGALDRIYSDEISPVCASWAPIGVWPAFDMDALNAQIERNKTKTALRLPKFVRDWQRRLRTATTRREWEQVRVYLDNPDRLRIDIQKLRKEAAFKM